MNMENLTGKQAAKFIREHKGKIYVDVTVCFGDHFVRVPVVKSDLALAMDSIGDADGQQIFFDECGDCVFHRAEVPY